MRIVQLIDSLEVGGAEKMAVNFANSLSQKISFSGLVATRKEGSLKNEIGGAVNYFFLDKKKTIDPAAILRFRAYCKNNKVAIVHAHGSSFFIAFLLKMVYPKIKIIWHDHNGDRSNQRKRQNLALLFCARFFSGIIVVNHKLEKWSSEQLNIKNVIYLPNFTVVGNVEDQKTNLSGIQGKRILYLANLRHPKNHKLLLEAAVKIKQKHPDWTFHLVGSDKNDAYSAEIKSFITRHNLRDAVYLYGLKTDTAHIIMQSDIAVIASSYEGLPVSLLEYGLYRKAVVVTHVGEIPLIVSNGQNGLMVGPNDTQSFYDALVTLMADASLRAKFGEALYQTIAANHSEIAVVAQYLEWIKNV